MTSMNLSAVIATTASLAMDAFSISICIGLAGQTANIRNGMTTGAVFGLFQFIMPLVGAAAAGQVAEVLDNWAVWVASGLIVFVALKMIYETFKSGGNYPALNLSAANLLMLGLATSIDALSVGFSIKSANGSATLLALSAGAITFVLSLLGCIGGMVLGAKNGARAQYFGGAVLLAIAAYILLSQGAGY